MPLYENCHMKYTLVTTKKFATIGLNFLYKTSGIASKRFVKYMTPNKLIDIFI
jgi:hypothetical protein